MLKSFRDLLVWQKSYTLALRAYEATTGFPAKEAYGLAAQIRRAAVSIPSNIAEGYARWHTAEYIRFARMAFGSLAELQTQLMLARTLDYMERSTYDALAGGYEEVERMLGALIRGLNEKRGAAPSAP